MTSRLRARMLAGVCAVLVVVSSAGCQTIYPSSRPYEGIGATRNAAGDVIILVRTCQGLAATKAATERQWLSAVDARLHRRHFAIDPFPGRTGGLRLDGRSSASSPV